MKYRLSMKILGEAGPGRSAIGWAVIRFAEPSVQTGAGELPEVHEPVQLVTIGYASPSEMLVPMSDADVLAARQHALDGLPEGSQLLQVSFDAADFAQWRAQTGYLDSHEARSGWALRAAANWDMRGTEAPATRSVRDAT